MVMNGKCFFFKQEFWQRCITSIILISLGTVTYFYYPKTLSFIVIGLLLIVLFDEWPRLTYNSQRLKHITPLYPVLPFILLILLNQSSMRMWLLILFCTVTTFDTVSYLVGNLLGKHKIAPTISPGKTWEGFIGGCIGACIAFIYCAKLFSLSLPIFTQFLQALSLSVAAFFGDLWVSYLKRRVGLKDTGALLPGHGGILDRFDGILFAAYILSIFLLM